ncbi:hypothetical protein [Alteraurantiacibacter buctensis]|uniref:PepSY domain-containing protein n=1 Tax=Alteraurantiacibacter buctensis TaxID=1503981 RepID=A0A844YZT5_9SPHN|nr:hypothetical protein [Alteraurantiacibacter buctensis]MXO72526.1 hypothetical protein [Alteraurantiacibacter buctensis]
MKRIIAPLAVLALLTGPVLADVALAQTRGNGGAVASEQQRAREQMQAGRNLSIREIERRILPQMAGDEYIGFEYDPSASAYRLKFVRDGQMIWVDVDARTARVLRVSR